jgi:hypothetical protein
MKTWISALCIGGGFVVGMGLGACIEKYYFQKNEAVVVREEKQKLGEQIKKYIDATCFYKASDEDDYDVEQEALKNAKSLER